MKSGNATASPLPNSSPVPTGADMSSWACDQCSKQSTFAAASWPGTKTGVHAGFRRASEFDARDMPGQDFVCYQSDTTHVVGVVVDGVSQSTVPAQAASAIGEQLLAYFWNHRTAPPDSSTLSGILGGIAKRIQSQEEEAVSRIQVHAQFQRIKQRRRETGTEAVFAAVILDTLHREAVFYIIGDPLVKARLSNGQEVNLSAPTSEFRLGRWSSRAKDCFNQPVRQIPLQQVASVLLHSDGLPEETPVDDPEFGNADELARKFDRVHCTRDDVSFFRAAPLTSPGPWNAEQKPPTTLALPFPTSSAPPSFDSGQPIPETSLSPFAPRPPENLPPRASLPPLRPTPAQEPSTSTPPNNAALALLLPTTEKSTDQNGRVSARRRHWLDLLRDVIAFCLGLLAMIFYVEVSARWNLCVTAPGILSRGGLLNMDTCPMRVLPPAPALTKPDWREVARPGREQPSPRVAPEQAPVSPTLVRPQTGEAPRPAPPANTTTAAQPPVPSSVIRRPTAPTKSVVEHPPRARAAQPGALAPTAGPSEIVIPLAVPFGSESPANRQDPAH